jgi:tRNA(Ile)-lysidine synthase
MSVNAKKFLWVGKLDRFLKTHWNQRQRLLLGYSGGGDSKALLYGLMELGFKELDVVHVNHGWRKESGAEAALLQKEVEGLGLRFHGFVCSPSSKGNKEEEARDQRLSFFQTLFDTENYQAIFLAHHLEDLGETVLKRIFEGSHLPSLGGMDETSLIGTLQVWRPLLSVEKLELTRFLEARELSPIDDATNRDPQFLRARLRGEVFPFLQQTFKKKITNNLFLLANRSFELKEYLDKKTEGVPISCTPSGVSVDLSELETIEARHLVTKLLKQAKISLHRTQLENLLLWATIKKRSFISDRVYVEGGKIFINR